MWHELRYIVGEVTGPHSVAVVALFVTARVLVELIRARTAVVVARTLTHTHDLSIKTKTIDVEATKSAHGNVAAE